MSNVYWGGFVRSLNSSFSFIEGSVGHENWFYSIGTISSAYGQKKIPANQVVNCVYLWLRITDTSIFSYIFNCSYKQKKLFFHNFLHCFLIFIS